MNEASAQTVINKIEENPKTRKRKLDPEQSWAKCQTCLGVGNLDNLIRHGIPVKDNQGVELYGAFKYVYFCGENCKGLFREK